MNLSDEAKSALINDRHNGGMQAPPAVLAELRQNRLIGRLGGRTHRGDIVRQRLLAEAEEKAFGA
jgi:hypothetical protein